MNDTAAIPPRGNRGKQMSMAAIGERARAAENKRAETRIHWCDVRDRAAFWYVRQAMRGQEVAETREELKQALWDAVRRCSAGESIDREPRGGIS
jgi:hypothetical protein